MRASTRLPSLLSLCLVAACGGASQGAQSTTPVATTTRTVAGEGWSLALPESFTERLPAGVDAWFESLDGGTMITVRVLAGAEDDVPDADEIATTLEAEYEATGAQCGVHGDVGDEPAHATRRVQCTHTELRPSVEGGAPIDAVTIDVMVRGSAAYLVACADRADACAPILASVRIDSAILPTGRASAASLRRSLAYVARYPLDSDLPGANATRFAVPIEGAPARGATTPLVTMVQFTDLECPFCNRAEGTLARLREAYPDTLRIVVRHHPLPFHQNAEMAAEAVEDARAQGVEDARAQGGDVAFFRLFDAIFRAPRGWGRPEILALASTAGLDPVAIGVALDDHRHLARIEADKAFASRFVAHGTPVFFINGRRLAGAQPFEVFKAMIDEELALARNAMDDGVPIEGLYAAALAHALDHASEEAPPPPNPTPARPEYDVSFVYKVPADGFPFEGPRDALVTIVEFTDFQCPFCARSRATLAELRTIYGDSLRIVHRQHPLPFHEQAGLAAEAALEVFAQKGNAGFLAYSGLLFANQRTLDRASIETYAQQVGADMRRFRRALDAHTHQPAITADSELTTALGAGGTPTFFINGRLLRGAQPTDVFRTAIDRALEEARARVAGGTPVRRLYQTLVRDGLTAAPTEATP